MAQPSASPTPAALPWWTRALIVALAARTAFLCGGYFFRFPNFQRYKLESAALALVVAGGVLHAVFSRDSTTSMRWAPRPSRSEWIGWCVASLLLYWPSVHLGFLSDDFVLIDRVRHHAFGFVHAELFRPVPLLAWGAILALRGGPVALHALNILAHGMVAFLVSRVAAPFVPNRFLAVSAGALVLTFPAAIEAVTWISGVFDVTATMLMLSAIVAARSYGVHPRLSSRVSFFVYVVAALLCKEIAIVIPAVIALDAWATRRWSRALRVDTLSLTAAFACVGVVRWALSSSMVRRPVTRYVLQRWLFGTVGGLAVPWHEQIASSRPWIPFVGALLVIGLTTLFLIRRSSSERTRMAAACAGWGLLGTLPMVTFFFVANNLEGSRYLYFPAAGYALLLVTMAGNVPRPAPTAIATGSIVTLVLLGVIGVRWHQGFWRHAADVRDTVLAAARADPRLRSCGTVALAGLPETENGARLFGNAELAFAPIGLVLSDQAPASCAFTWDRTTTAFTATRK